MFEDRIHPPCCNTCNTCGKVSWEVENQYDGHGIYLGRWCPQCTSEGLSHFRPDIMTKYDADEPIEPDDWF